VLLELGCQNTSRRYWWDFTAGQLSDEGRRMPAPREALVTSGAVSNGAAEHSTNGNGHLTLPTLSVAPAAEEDLDLVPEPTVLSTPPLAELAPVVAETVPAIAPVPSVAIAPPAPDALKDAFVRQLQLDRLTLRQMRSLLMSEEARRAIEVAIGATEATYERLALILFGADLPQLLGKPLAAPAAPVMSAEERLELQREKARIRARLRRAAIKAAKVSS
jgi:hypothetical protein